MSCLFACTLTPPTPPPTASTTVTFTVIADGKTQNYTFSANLTVREALVQAGIALGDLDRLTPAPYTRLSEGLTVRITRIRETFETEQNVVPFESQTVKNEGLPEGERRLLQAGVNGLEEITYRTLFEDGAQISRAIVRHTYLTPPTPEIVMVGAQTSFTILPISGTLTYLNANNAWVMRGNSSQRLPLTTSGDLNGFVFDLSPDGRWLLYTRAVTDPDSILFNTLWAITIGVNAKPLGLGVNNVLYAEWSPVFTQTIAYSTAEKTNRAPGWQANNDLWLLNWGVNSKTRKTEFISRTVLGPSSGGLYGWWGTGYKFAPDGATIAFARTDSVGVVDVASGERQTLAQFTAFNSRSDWAWYPALEWAPGGWLYTVLHGAPLGLELPEDSPVFNLAAIAAFGPPRTIELVKQAGMFANPILSPNGQIAYLQAVDPDNSPRSRYRLGVMDRDGSNARLLFPADDQPGLIAGETPVWSLDGQRLAVIYEGNLWLIDAASGIAQQLTGDGLTQKPQWGE